MKVFILTGAGISADSGLKTFRDFDNGLWNDHKISEVCEAGCFEKNKSLVNKFYSDMKREFEPCEPNAAHISISEFINNSEHEVMLVTQNIDNLHEKAGSKKVIHMHGSLHSSLCVNCGETTPLGANKFLDVDNKCVVCRNDTLRPDIVFFEEMPYRMHDIINFLEDVDIFVAIGTSGIVYPAAGFVEIAKRKNRNSSRVFINKNLNDVSKDFNVKIIGNAKDVVPDFFNNLENYV